MNVDFDFICGRGYLSENLDLRQQTDRKVRVLQRCVPGLTLIKEVGNGVGQWWHGAPAEGWGLRAEGFRLSLRRLSPFCRHRAICSPQLPREGRQFHLYIEKQKLWNQKFAQGHLLGLTLDPCKLTMPERVGQVGILPESFQVGRKSGQAEAPAMSVTRPPSTLESTHLAATAFSRTGCGSERLKSLHFLPPAAFWCILPLQVGIFSFGCVRILSQTQRSVSNLHLGFCCCSLGVPSGTE